MNKKIATASICLISALSIGSAFAQSSDTSNNSLNHTNTKNWNAQTNAQQPQDWDGVGKPGVIPKGDNPKWYQDNNEHESNYQKAKHSVKRHWHNTKVKTHEDYKKFEDKHPKIAHPIKSHEDNTDK